MVKAPRPNLPDELAEAKRRAHEAVARSRRLQARAKATAELSRRLVKESEGIKRPGGRTRNG